jgi:RNA polymerase sigma-70 factor (ECF subfamily)
MRSIEDRDAIEGFPELRARREVLGRFSAPVSVVAYLAHEGGDVDHKDRVLRALVQEVREGVALRLSYSLLLLCLWPGLDAAFGRRLRLFRQQREDLAVELVDRFTTEICRIDLDRVTRVAATLVRNTEREVVVSRCRELKLAARFRQLSPEVAAARTLEPYLSPFGLNVGDSDDDSINTIRGWLERAIGRDADLLVQVVIHGRSRSELAAVLGTSRDTLDKRVQRALGRARRVLDVDSVSAPAIDLAFANA